MIVRELNIDGTVIYELYRINGIAKRARDMSGIAGIGQIGHTPSNGFPENWLFKD